MSEIRLYLDEDVEAHALVQALRSRGVDVITTSETGLTETSDEAQLTRAFQERRALLTYNAADFCRLHKQFIQNSRQHSGIIIAEQQRQSVGEMTRSLLRLVAKLDAETMQNRLEFLNRWS